MKVGALALAFDFARASAAFCFAFVDAGAAVGVEGRLSPRLEKRDASSESSYEGGGCDSGSLLGVEGRSKGDGLLCWEEFCEGAEGFLD